MEVMGAQRTYQYNTENLSVSGVRENWWACLLEGA
jgi:hypothetical protein